MNRRDKNYVPTELDIHKFEQKVQAFSWSFMTDFVTFLRMLHEKGIDLNWAIKCILTRQKVTIVNRAERRRLDKEWRTRARKCPRCGKIMRLGRLNDGPATSVGAGLQSQWICPDQPRYDTDYSVPGAPSFCGHTEEYKRSVESWILKLGMDLKAIRKIPRPFIVDDRFNFGVAREGKDWMDAQEESKADEMARMKADHEAANKGE